MDTFANFGASLISPAEHATAITPNDDADLTYVTRALYVGGDGNVTGITAGGETITVVGLLAGMLYPFRFVRIKATGTSATNLVGWY